MFSLIPQYTKSVILAYGSATFFLSSSFLLSTKFFFEEVLSTSPFNKPKLPLRPVVHVLLHPLFLLSETIEGYRILLLFSSGPRILLFLLNMWKDKNIGCKVDI